MEDADKRKQHTWLSDDQDTFQQQLHSHEPEWNIWRLIQVNVGNSGNRKIIRYDADNILGYGFFLPLAEGTVFSAAVGGRTFWQSMAQYFLVLCFFTVIPVLADQTADPKEAFEARLLEGLNPVATGLKRVCPFVFGLFISTTVSRWWALRNDALGKVMTASVRVAQFIAENCTLKEVHEDYEEWTRLEQDYVRLVKYGVASIQCCVMESRQQYDVGPLIREELLSTEEAEILDRCCRPTHEGRAHVLWAWILAVGWSMLERLKMPPPQHNALLMEFKDASRALSRMEAYFDSQMPFCYVHGIVFMVFMHNVVISAVLGLNVANSLRVAEFGRSATSLVLLRLLHIMLVPAIYQALLQICFLLQDPLGDDITDFPIRAFQAKTYDSGKQILGACRHFFQLRSEAARRKSALAEVRLREMQAAMPEPAAPVPVKESPPAPPQVDSEELSRRLAKELNASSGLMALHAQLDELEGKIRQAEKMKAATPVDTLPAITGAENLEPNELLPRSPAAVAAGPPPAGPPPPLMLGSSELHSSIAASSNRQQAAPLPQLGGTPKEAKSGGIPPERPKGHAAPVGPGGYQRTPPVLEGGVERDCKERGSWLQVCSCSM